jgi:hypothetical protein
MFDRFSRPTLYNVLTCRTPPADNLFIDFETHTAHYKSANPKSNRSNSSRSSYVGPLTGKNGSHHKVVIIGTKTNCCDAIKIGRQKKILHRIDYAARKWGKSKRDVAKICLFSSACLYLLDRIPKIELSSHLRKV